MYFGPQLSGSLNLFTPFIVISFISVYIVKFKIFAKTKIWKFILTQYKI